jgi:hypothetical protein
MSIELCLVWQDDELWHDQWTYVCRNFGVDRVYFLQAGPKAKGFRSISCKAIDDLAELPKGKRPVLMASEHGRHFFGETSLQDFEHSENDVFIIGHDHQFLTPPDLAGTAIDHYVYVPTATDDETFSWVCGAVLLWDRKSKWPTK